MFPPSAHGSMPPGMAGPPGPPQGAGKPDQNAVVQHLRAAIDNAQAALQAEPNDADSQALAKIVQALYAILAQRQKQVQQVMGNPAAQQVISRSMGNG